MTSNNTEAPDTQAPQPPSGWFVTTQWSVVLTAGRIDTERAHTALEQLCRNYWQTIYAYVRRGDAQGRKLKT
jgi:hypothetical protein